MIAPEALVFTWDVACPKCGATPGKPCVRYRNGRFHVLRTRAAASRAARLGREVAS